MTTVIPAQDVKSGRLQDKLSTAGLQILIMNTDEAKVGPRDGPEEQHPNAESMIKSKADNSGGVIADTSAQQGCPTLFAAPLLLSSIATLPLSMAEIMVCGSELSCPQDQTARPCLPSEHYRSHCSTTLKISCFQICDSQAEQSVCSSVDALETVPPSRAV